MARELIAGQPAGPHGRSPRPHRGPAIEWDAALQSNTRLGPPEYEFVPFPMPPVAMPGVYQFS